MVDWLASLCVICTRILCLKTMNARLQLDLKPRVLLQHQCKTLRRWQLIGERYQKDQKETFWGGHILLTTKTQAALHYTYAHML